MVRGLLLVGTMVLINGAFAQEYPNKPIRIATAPAGGANDYAARLIGQTISAALGQQVIYDNRAPVIARETVAKAPPDGYTVLFDSDALWTFAFFEAVSYDAVKDFAPIALTGRSPNILVVHPSIPATTVKQLIALAKARPGELNYGNTGLGSATHLAAELFKSMAGVNIISVNYKGGAAANTALVSGEIQLLFGVVTSSLPLIKAGRLKALAVASAEPTALAPGLPTISAAGLPGFQSASTQGLWVPAKTPAAVIARLNQETLRAINRPDVKEKFFAVGVDTMGTTPEQAAVFVDGNKALVQKLVKSAVLR